LIYKDKIMRSMTGFGRATAIQNNNQVTIEISAVNSKKQTDIRTNLPRELLFLERVIKKIIAQKVVRGNLSVNVNYEIDAQYRKEQLQVDFEVAEYLVETLQKFAKKVGISDEIKIADLLQIPGIIVENNTLPNEVIVELCIKALNKALDELQTMQSEEGKTIAKDLTMRHKNMVKLLQTIKKHTNQSLILLKERLVERIKLFDIELSLDDERLHKELAFFAEKSDINEEVVRLESHLTQLLELITKEESPGRTLNFLSQEIGREINTLASKTCDATVSQASMEFKNELNRLKEQIMNVE